MAGPLTWQGSGVDMTTVERQLSRLWGELITDQNMKSAVRTHVSNLVVYTDSKAEADRVSGILGQLSQRQPSRAVILLANRREQDTRVDAVTTVHCSGGGSDVPLCYEQVLITARGRAADHLSSVVIPLLMPEIPTFLWWPGQPPFSHRSFHRLLSIANQLVIDSAAFQSPGDGLANVARIAAGKQGVRDFQWAKLAPIREIVAQFFDAPTWVPYTEGIRSVRFEFGAGGNEPGRPTASTLLLLGWLGHQLGWEPETTLDGPLTADISLTVIQGERTIPIEIHFADHGEKAAGRLMQLELVSQPKGEAPARFSVERTADLQHATVRTRVHEGSDITRVVPLELKADVDLLGEELDSAGHDSLYGLVACMASRMAGREVWLTT
jgi:glucose-6-phosphate dehydrogenase assembly protein OpcA